MDDERSTGSVAVVFQRHMSIKKPDSGVWPGMGDRVCPTPGLACRLGPILSNEICINDMEDVWSLGIN